MANDAVKISARYFPFAVAGAVSSFVLMKTSAERSSVVAKLHIVLHILLAHNFAEFSYQMVALKILCLSLYWIARKERPENTNRLK